MITFKPGKQIAGTVVIDNAGVAWRVLKDIANAQAPPREGAYYTRYIEESPTVIERLEAVEEWIAKHGGTLVLPKHPVIIPEPRAAGRPALKDMFGVNFYPWDATQNPMNPNLNSEVYEPKMNLLKSFVGGGRLYLDWRYLEFEKGSYTYELTHAGSWPLDTILSRYASEGIDLLFCLKEPPQWLINTYPATQARDHNNIPAPYGSDFSQPKSFEYFAAMGYQLAARWGFNKNVPVETLTVNNKPRWTNDPVNIVKVGMGVLKYVEADNERDRWWLKDKRGFLTGRQYAAQMSAFYDGDKGRIGKYVGVKTADPSMIVVMGGLAAPSVEYVREMVDWCRENRGYREDGTVDLCWDVINYHQYSNDSQDSGQWGYASRGVAPELRSLPVYAKEFVALGNELNIPVWVTETGYDVLPTPQSANPIGNKSAEEVQADWIIRTALLYARCGVKRVFFYQLFDDNPGSGIQYSSSGLAVCNDKETRKRPAALLIDKFTAEIGDYSYVETLSMDPIVDVYTKDGQYAYVCFIADETGREMVYTLTKKDGTTGSVKLTETPVIIK